MTIERRTSLQVILCKDLKQPKEGNKRQQIVCKELRKSSDTELLKPDEK